MRFVAAELQKLSNEEIAKIEKEGSIKINVDGNEETISLNEVEISTQDIEGWLVANQGNLTVALDVTITDELKNEGIARELVNRVQNIRKDSGFEVTDRIRLFLKRDGILENAIQENAEYIKNETLTNELIFKDVIENGNNIEFDDVKTLLLIEKV